ncbi:MAG TPA: hypothetical protein VM925_33145 [Labilithrix sp.]|nr:hypothetical protein [Labilithrix sp.]
MTTNRVSVQWLLVLGALAALPGCASNSSGDAGAESDFTGSGNTVESVVNISDFGNQARIKGTIGYVEGTATLLLANRSREAAEIRVTVTGGTGFEFGPFEVDVSFGGIENPSVKPGDCVSVMQAPEMTDGPPKEFAAFLWAYHNGAGMNEPYWLESGVAKVYASTEACLSDVTRNTKNTLESVANISDFGNQARIKGTIGYVEGQATLVLANRTRKEPEIKVLVTGGNGFSVGPFEVDASFGDIENPSVEAGDCVSVMQAPEMVEAPPKEFAAFRWAYKTGEGTWNPSWAKSTKLYATAEQCLRDGQNP